MTEPPRPRRRLPLGSILFGVILITIGLLFLLGVDFFPAILIVIGAVIVVSGLLTWYTGEPVRLEKTP